MKKYFLYKLIYNFLIFLKLKKKPKECLHDEYCPIYLAFLGKYSENNPEKLKYCKNSEGQYCTKYRLVAGKDWKKMKIEKRLQFIKDLQLIEFIEKLKIKP